MRARSLAAVIVGFAALPVFCYATPGYDHQAHIRFARELLSGKRVLPHPLYHLSLIVLTGGQLGSPATGIAALLLTLALVARTWLAVGKFPEGTRTSLAVAVGVLLAFAMPFPAWWQQDRVLGQPNNTLWNNPTEIFGAPFAVWLFQEGLTLLRAPTARQSAVVGGVMALAMLAKPNFVLAFAPVYGLTVVAELWKVRKPLWLVPVLGPAAAVAVGQWLWLRGSAVVFFAPGAVWGVHSKSIPGSIVAGVAFPLVTTLCYPHRANEDASMKLAWVTFGVAAGTFYCMADSGSTGDWRWGMDLAATVLFAAAAAFLLGQRTDWRRWLCLAVLGGHALSGADYVRQVIQDPKSLHLF